MGGQDGDPAHGGGGQQTASGHGQLEREESAGADDLVAVERGERAVELEARPIELQARGIGALAEGDEVGASEPRQLVARDRSKQRSRKPRSLV